MAEAEEPTLDTEQQDEYEDEGEEEEDDGESDDTWESDLDSEAEIAEIMQLDLAEENANSGKREYLAKCSELKIVPIAMFIAKLDCEHINLRHHGMGVKGALAISAALVVNTQIRSLNLGDNWLRDDGVHALAGVLKDNTSLTSLNLADNKIGLPGVLSLCRYLPEASLAELSLKGNELTDRAAVPLAEALKASSSLTKVDLSYNSFAEEAGKHFGDMLNGHSVLLDVNLKWNALKWKGALAVAEGLKGNQVLNKVDLGWNGLGDKGMKAVGDMLANNQALTHLDVSYNKCNPEGCLSLAEGIKANHNLLYLEAGFNPMGLDMSTGKLSSSPTAAGITELIKALKDSESIEAVGLSNVHQPGQGRGTRFDPKNPDGHYTLDVAQPWDRFIVETLYARMSGEKGESWINTMVNNANGLGSVQVDIPQQGWEIPSTGIFDFDYVTWRRGLEASFKLDLSNPCDLFIGEKLLAKASAAEASDDDGAEELRECKLNDEPFEISATLPAHGLLQVVYFSTLQQDTISFPVELDLSQANSRAILLRLWERAITTPTDFWSACTIDGVDTGYTGWNYPNVPDSGDMVLTYAVRLSIKPYDRGVFFSQPMATTPFNGLTATLNGHPGQASSDYDKINLLKQAAMRNYFTSIQVRALIDTLAYRKGKIEASVLLHPRTTDQANFVHALRSLDKETDRADILEMVGASIKRKTRKAMGTAAGNAKTISGALGAIEQLQAAHHKEGATPAAAPATK
uniref:DUF4476 domain-containing protein n=1 Tax=Haptolina brevifila TaxID=156173 RepID=A0A7S2DWN5_9EUKA|mmetsp:Transcript_45026/g.89926  ORF Transcript_45026/g.89926 Transcript_45026/m.89926 type:complete len:745 (+) Transcript_45026:105-2339(+)